MSSRAKAKENLLSMVRWPEAAPPSLLSYLWLGPWIPFQGSILPQTTDVRLLMGIPEIRFLHTVLSLLLQIEVFAGRGLGAGRGHFSCVLGLDPMKGRACLNGLIRP